MKRSWLPHIAARLATHALDQADHARLDIECPRCRELHTAWTWIYPDPRGHAYAINAEKAASWQRSHPCVTATAHPRRKVAA